MRLPLPSTSESSLPDEVKTWALPSLNERLKLPSIFLLICPKKSVCTGENDPLPSPVKSVPFPSGVYNFSDVALLISSDSSYLVDQPFPNIPEREARLLYDRTKLIASPRPGR